MTPKRCLLDIEDALGWAFRDELPKGCRDRGGYTGPREPLSLMARMAAHGGSVDNWSREPGFPVAMGEPHPDAREIGRRVAALRDWTPPPLPAAWLAPDFAGLGIDEADMLRRALPSVQTIVVTSAKLRRRPLFDPAPMPGRRILSNGRAAVLEPDYVIQTTVDGRDIGRDTVRPAAQIRAGVYRPGAYCPLVYDPDPAAVALERAEYAVWHAALVALAAQLAGGLLRSLSILPPSAPARPWAGEVDSGKPVPIRDDLRARVHRTDRAEDALRRRTPSARRRPSRDPGRRVPRESWPARHQNRAADA